MNFGLEIYFTLIISIFWILILQWIFRKKTTTTYLNLQQTKISILLAARNEETTIRRCLQSLNNLQFPSENIEILIGNDASTDGTEAIVRDYISDKPKFRLRNITSQIGIAKGKANVLAQLAQEAKGDYLFITDADIEVQPDWLNAMLTNVTPETGIVTGYTHIDGENLLAKLQALDWTFAQAVMKIFFDTDKPLSAMGNNMMVTKDAYLKTGGYENIPFSLTEDFALFEKVYQLHYECIQVVDDKVKAVALPMKNIPAIISQRKRWTLGVKNKIPWYLSFLLMIQMLFLPVACYLSFVNLNYTLVAVLIKWTIQSLFLLMVMRTVKEKTTFIALFLFDFYSFFIGITTTISILKSKNVVWKDRNYLSKNE